MPRVQPIHLKNVRFEIRVKTDQHDLIFTDVFLDDAPRGTVTVDLKGYAVFPGMFNAHDHLELNHYPRTKFRERYDNAHQWGEDVNARLDDEPFRSLRAYPLEDRLFIGGLKNLLCGATTVAHHNPPHKALFHRDFPVRVVRHYGWAHSLHFNTEAEIIASYKNTPPDAPWFIHLAEGTDHVARSEYRRLRQLGCTGENTIIIHGIGLTYEDVYDPRNAPRPNVIACPSTNQYLLGTYPTNVVLWFGSLILGSDSRLTSDGDLLDELRILAALKPTDNPYVVWRAVRQPWWRFWRDKPAIGELKTGYLADFIALKDDYDTRYPNLLINARRADLALVVRGGVPQIGDPDVMARFPHVETVPATLDGVPKAVNLQLARQIARCTLQEPGLALEMPIKRRGG
jgi:cytosine/adenosine deaminase-related metal-dependent hydrolase